MNVNFPGDTDRLMEIGRTGSGKTQAACFELSYRNFDRKPWVIFDTKGDPFIAKLAKLEGVKTISFGDTIGDKGLYIIRPLPKIDAENTDNFLWRIHARNNVGLYFDEGYMIDKTDALDAILTQGRSKHIPVIMLSQRPAWLTKFAFTEADFLQVFHLTYQEDRKIVQKYIPADRANLENRLPPYHSLWYDVKDDQVSKFRPVPPAGAILETFKTRLERQRVYI